jgi:hypothetical protein
MPWCDNLHQHAGRPHGDDAAARDLARRVNELSAELIQERPDRFGRFAIGSTIDGSTRGHL